MRIALWLKFVFYFLGAIAISSLIYFVGPLIAYGTFTPFQSPAAIWAGIALTFMGTISAAVFSWVYRKKAEAHLAAGMQGFGTGGAAGAEAEAEKEAPGDGAVLQDRMKDALATLKKSQGGTGDYLYDLPWYIIIGPPGSGKTTALVNSGLKFPLARGLTPQAVAGQGGTRYCDWWFTEDAVLIDTAGRYTTQDSDSKGDQKSWLSFLELLKDNRPKQPINGVILCISLEDLLSASEKELEAHSDAIRLRLIELHDKLKVDFPVYALFTKADLVAGFMEFFAHLNEAGRRAVWGSTFQTDDKTKNMVHNVSDEFDLLIERLNLELIDRLQEEPTPTAKVQIFGFPSQMAAVRAPVIAFLNKIFEPTRYHANATLRGFYFTSGTQQGTPIDGLIGALSRSFGTQDQGVGGYSGVGKSFFLTELINRVIIGEAGWVSTDKRAMRRGLILRIAGYSAIALLTLGAGIAWWVSYGNNSALIGESFASASRYRTIGEEIRNETLIRDGDVSKALRHLHHLRTQPAGYGQRDVPVPLSHTFGLSQWSRLNSAAEVSYQEGLERHFRSRLMWRLEDQMRAAKDDAGFIYEALNIYLMIGGREKVDKEQVLSWFRRDWQENLYPGAGNADGRKALEEHLVALLSFDPPPEARAIPLDESLIADAQATLARMGVVDRAYEVLRSAARRRGDRDWVARVRAGQDAAIVLDGTGGEPLDAIRVPYFYTYNGFHEAFLGQLADVRQQVERERRLLGSAGDQTAVQQQMRDLEAQLLERYGRDFVAAWQATLRKIRVKSLIADRPRYVVLDAAARATSPLATLIESIREETTLTRERPRQAPAAGQPAQGAPPAIVLPGGQAPGAAIEAQFRAYHVLSEGDRGRRPVDELLKNLTDIHQTLIQMNDPAQTAAASQIFRTHIASLRASTSRFPPPFNTMIQTAANSLDGDATGTQVARLAQMVLEQVTRPCQQLVSGRYPFARGSATDIGMQEFQQVFGTQQLLDRFFQANLAAHVDTTRGPWQWNATSPLRTQMPVSLLASFQRAQQIREAFMPAGVAGFSFVAKNLSIPQDVDSVRLEINGGVLLTENALAAPPPGAPSGGFGGLFGSPAPPPSAPARPPVEPPPTQFQWPGPQGLSKAAVVIALDRTGRQQTLERPGPWGLFRLLEGNTRLAGQSIVAVLNVGGRAVSYQINVAAPVNPLSPQALATVRQFTCPAMQ
jgi:type VI secretion system protein ImpL